METITVQLGDRSYPVIVGAGARHQLDSVVPSTAKRAAIVTQETVPWAVRPGVEIGVLRGGERLSQTAQRRAFGGPLHRQRQQRARGGVGAAIDDGGADRAAVEGL